MANISDIIERFLIESLGGRDKLNINRNELADYFACAPSQINYVLTTRFTLDRGYLIESRRGGGGYITLLKISAASEVLDELGKLNISEGLTFLRASHIIDRLIGEGHLSEREGELIRAMLSDKSLVAPGVNKDTLRASLMKSLALQLSKRRN